MTVKCGVTGNLCELPRCLDKSCVLHAAGVTKQMAEKPVVAMAMEYAAAGMTAGEWIDRRPPGVTYTTAALLTEREKTYGDFGDVSRVVQDIKDIVRRENVSRDFRRQKALTPKHLEALDCIAMKMARILSGDPDYADNWDDIAGYAKLCSTTVPTPPRKFDWANPTVNRRVRQRRSEPFGNYHIGRRNTAIDRRKGD